MNYSLINSAFTNKFLTAVNASACVNVPCGSKTPLPFPLKIPVFTTLLTESSAQSETSFLSLYWLSLLPLSYSKLKTFIALAYIAIASSLVMVLSALKEPSGYPLIIPHSFAF